MKGTTSHEHHDNNPGRSAVHRDHRRRPHWQLLRAASRSRFRDTIGTSSGECRGLIDLLVAEARQHGASPMNVKSVLALLPATARTPQGKTMKISADGATARWT
jgi:hypothetical protein